MPYNTIADDIRVLEHLDLPEYDDLSNASLEQPSLVYATGNGPDAEGVYVYNGSNYELVGGGTTTNAALGYASVAQTGIAFETETAWEYDTVVYDQGDSGSLADPTNNQFVIQEDGIYLLGGIFEWQSSSGWATGDELLVKIRVNNNDIWKYTFPKTGTVYQGIPAGPTPASLSQGDTVDVTLYHSANDGTSKDLFADRWRSQFGVSQLKVGSGGSSDDYDGTPQDVRTRTNPSVGDMAMHDGTGGYPEAPAYYVDVDGTNQWVSVLNGEVIS